MNYTHLSQSERYQIYSMLVLLPVGDIAKHLGCHESTIRRELVRNRGRRNAVCITPELWSRVDELLRAQHSPEQIAGCVNISHETVYQHVYADATGELKSHLRCQKKRKKRYVSGASRRGQIPNRCGIEERCTAVETKKESSIGRLTP